MVRIGLGEAQHTRVLTPGDVAQLHCPGAEAVLDHPTWARAAMSEWGICGIGCVTGGMVTGFVLVSTALHVPREHPLALGANAQAAALLAVSDDGCGRRLVQSLAAHLVGRRTITAIDAAASGPGTVLSPSYEWLGSVGFHPVDGDPYRYRLDLRGTRSWLPDLSGAMQRLRDLVRPTPPPEPAARYDLSPVP